jgi:hypothetical protein
MLPTKGVLYVLTRILICGSAALVPRPLCPGEIARAEIELSCTVSAESVALDLVISISFVFGEYCPRALRHKLQPDFVGRTPLEVIAVAMILNVVGRERFENGLAVVEILVQIEDEILKLQLLWFPNGLPLRFAPFRGHIPWLGRAPTLGHTGTCNHWLSKAKGSVNDNEPWLASAPFVHKGVKLERANRLVILNSLEMGLDNLRNDKLPISGKVYELIDLFNENIDPVCV